MNDKSGWVKLGDIMTKEELEEYAQCLQVISKKSKEEQEEILDKLLDEIDKLGTKESILYKHPGLLE